MKALIWKARYAWFLHRRTGMALRYCWDNAKDSYPYCHDECPKVSAWAEVECWSE